MSHPPGSTRHRTVTEPPRAAPAAAASRPRTTRSSAPTMRHPHLQLPERCTRGLPGATCARTAARRTKPRARRPPEHPHAPLLTSVPSRLREGQACAAHAACLLAPFSITLRFRLHAVRESRSELGGRGRGSRRLLLDRRAVIGSTWMPSGPGPAWPPPRPREHADDAEEGSGPLGSARRREHRQRTYRKDGHAQPTATPHPTSRRSRADHDEDGLAVRPRAIRSRSPASAGHGVRHTP